VAGRTGRGGTAPVFAGAGPMTMFSVGTAFTGVDLHAATIATVKARLDQAQQGGEAGAA
jgi:hypothetical protein